MRIDLHYQQRRCSEMTLVSGNIRLMGIFEGGSQERRRQMTVGLSKTAIFSTLSPYIFRSFRGKANRVTGVTLYCRVTLNENSNNDTLHGIGLPDIPYFTRAPVFQPQSPASRNEATREMKSPVFKLGPLTSHHSV